MQLARRRASLNTCTGDATEMADTWVNKGADGRLGSLGKREVELEGNKIDQLIAHDSGVVVGVFRAMKVSRQS